MNLHVLQHVPFEGPAGIQTWAESKYHRITRSRLYAGDPLPTPEAFDWLVVMGGPMGANDEADHSWLADEKRLIERAVRNGKTVLGVCLGAQLIAAVLGARVYRNREKEIGWHPVSLTGASDRSPAFRGLPKRFTVFHWHGDTFDLPAGCTRLAYSEACERQAFETTDGRVVAVQFHLETSREAMEGLIAHCAAELIPGPYVQEADRMRSGAGNLDSLKGYLDSVLDGLEANALR
jgi:GMP synthase-like glutamine amidotransferase